MKNTPTIDDSRYVRQLGLFSTICDETEGAEFVILRVGKEWEFEFTKLQRKFSSPNFMNALEQALDFVRDYRKPKDVEYTHTMFPYLFNTATIQ